MVLTRLPSAAEQFWGDSLGPVVTFGLSRISGALPLASIELLFGAWLAWRITAMIRAAWQVRRGERGRRHAALAFLLVLAQDAGVGVGFFYAAWGLNYARPPIELRMAWPDGELPAALVEKLARAEIDAANRAYLELHGAEDAGEPTRMGNRAELDAALEEGWRRAATELGLAGPIAWRHGRSKTLIISPLLRRAGLSGFYAPFTGEANINRSVPAVSQAHVIAHEKAHQRAIAPEDEANFFGWIAAARAPDPLARYSAHVFAHRQLVRTMMKSDRKGARELLTLRLPGVQRDVDDLYEYWQAARGRAAHLTRAVNDAYLKANRVEGGVAAYGGSVELLLRFASSRGDSLAAAPIVTPHGESRRIRDERPLGGTP